MLVRLVRDLPALWLLLSGCGRLGYETLSESRDGGIDATTAICGDGARSPGEQCDDGNGTPGDGCEADCTFSCTSDAACDDGETCNGIETCDPVTRRCGQGTALADGTSCGAMVCRAGACAPVGCGDGTVAGSEECDDMNTTTGDGCENDCTFTCSMDADCDDGAICNGAETCDSASHTCADGTPPPLGTACDRDGMPGTRDICTEADCRRSVCGDGYEDPATGELCDDGNTTGGDGCEGDCTPGTAGADAGTDAGSDAGDLPGLGCTSDRDCMFADTYCRFPDGTCAAPGSCAPTRVSCPGPFPPGTEVCGCNGTTFLSACQAYQAGESIAHDGPC